jgi:hypothetical protein
MTLQQEYEGSDYDITRRSIIDTHRICVNLCPFHDDDFAIAGDLTVHLTEFTLPQSHGIQAYWHEKSPTEESSEVLMEWSDVHSKKERRKGVFQRPYYFHTASWKL